MVLSSCKGESGGGKDAASEQANPKVSLTTALDDTSSQSMSTPAASATPSPPTMEDVGASDEVGVINTEFGDIVVEFFPDIAPLHTANFKKLARSGFYDGTTFHRVIPGFVIQGGDPNSKDSNPNNDGQGGPGYSLKAEFNDRPHIKGTLSMARSSDPNSAGSQFFICLDKTPHLDGKYTNFGRVIKGLDVVDRIGNLKRDPANRYDRSLPAVVMRSVKIVKRSELGL